jgi:hypothetical protein
VQKDVIKMWCGLAGSGWGGGGASDGDGGFYKNGEFPEQLTYEMFKNEAFQS